MSQQDCSSSSSSCASGGCAPADSLNGPPSANLAEGPPVPVQALSFLFSKGVAILRAAVGPYLLAFAIIYTGRSIGAPICFAISPWHVLALVAFDTAVVRLAMGPAYVSKGRTVLGFALPRPHWPGGRAVAGIVAAALQVMVPVGAVLFGLALILAEPVAAMDSLALKVGLLLIPVFVLNALLSLVIAITLSRLRQAQALREISCPST